jgi:Na+/melibiose symporter-like transporter
MQWAAVGIVFASMYPSDVSMQLIIPALIFSFVVIVAFVLLLVYVEEPDLAATQAAAKGANDGVVPMVRRLLRNPLYINYLKFKAPASIAFEVPTTIVAYYVQYSIRHTNPNAVQAVVTAAVVGGAIVGAPHITICPPPPPHTPNSRAAALLLL